MTTTIDVIPPPTPQIDVIVQSGPPGPTGPQGPAGPTGATGAQGPAGTNGLGVPAGGTINQVLTKNSSANNDTSWKTPAAGGFQWFNVQRFHNDWFYAWNPGGSGTMTSSVDGYANWWPWLCDCTCAIQQIAAEVSAASATAGAKIRLAIYADLGGTSMGQPGTLLFDSGQLVSDAVGTKTATLSPNLNVVSGTLYWLALSWQNTSGSNQSSSMRSYQAPWYPPFSIRFSTSSVTPGANLLTNVYGWGTATATIPGAWPNPAPTVGSGQLIYNTNVPPRIALQVN